jgi:hypothetical protein
MVPNDTLDPGDTVADVFEQLAPVQVRGLVMPLRLKTELYAPPAPLDPLVRPVAPTTWAAIGTEMTRARAIIARRI